MNTPKFYRCKGEVWAIVGEYYQPKGFVLKPATRHRPAKILKQGRFVKRTVYLDLSKNYGAKHVQDVDSTVSDNGDINNA